MTLLALAESHGLEPKKITTAKGGQYASPCPGCGGTDRFVIWAEENRYWCRQCHKQGDEIQFLRDFAGLSFVDACRRLGLDLPKNPPRATPRPPAPRRASTWTPAARRRPPELWTAKAEKCVAHAEKQLAESAPVKRWLDDRGIDDATARAARLGWLADDLWRPRKSWGLPENPHSKNFKLPGGLVIPCLEAGRPIRLRIRRPDTGVHKPDPRYWSVAGSSPAPLAVAGSRASSSPTQTMTTVSPPAVIVVESDLDALLLGRLAGDLATVLSLGSSAAKPDRPAHDIITAAPALLISLDFDAAGGAAWKWWSATYPRAKRWPVLEGKDPGEAYRAGGDLRAWVLAGLPPAWRIGPSLSREKKRGERPELNKSPEARELTELLRRYPVRLKRFPDGGMEILSRAEWREKHWDIYRRISDLVFRENAAEEKGPKAEGRRPKG